MKKQENNLKIINEKTLPISRKAVPELQLGLGPGARSLCLTLCWIKMKFQASSYKNAKTITTRLSTWTRSWMFANADLMEASSRCPVYKSTHATPPPAGQPMNSWKSLLATFSACATAFFIWCALSATPLPPSATVAWQSKAPASFFLVVRHWIPRIWPEAGPPVQECIPLMLLFVTL